MIQRQTRLEKETDMFAIGTRKIALGLGIAAGLLCAAGAAGAGTLENMERERALLVEVFLDPELDAQQRAEKISTAW
jgi:hypothetical protein